MIDWQSDESYLLHNPVLTVTSSELQLKNLLPGHLWVTTSGTTRAERRWVALSKTAILASARAVNQHLQVTSSDRWLLALPSFHVGGLGVKARAYLAGGDVVETSNWSAEEFYNQICFNQVTLSALVPTQVYDLVQMQKKAPAHLRAVVVGGGSLDAGLYAQARDLDWPLLPSFGMTECASQIATAELSSLHVTKKGLPALRVLPHVSCRMDARGCLELKSPALFSVCADWNGSQWQLSDPKVEGWFQTEDRILLEGPFLKPLGRINDQIKVRGELVDLARLNEVLQTLVLDLPVKVTACLLASPHPRLGQQISLVVSAAKIQNGFFYAEKLQQMFDQRVLPFERVQNLYFMDEIPQTDLGKVSRPQLRKQLGL